MPIGDLLAEISGGKSASSSATSLERSDSLPKRKAEDSLPGAAAKAPRVNAQPLKPSQPSRPLNGSNAVRRPTNGLGTSQGPKSTASTVTTKGQERPGAGRAPGAPSNGAVPRKTQPKKGSFADILARGQRAQAVMGQVGKIQHKRVDKRPASREKEGSKMERTPHGKRPPGYERPADPDRRGAATSRGPAKQGHHGLPARPSQDARNRAKVAEPDGQKKAKKAAQATTGYTGTARPKPGASSKRDGPQRGGALLNAPAHKTGSSKHVSYNDEYDEELDDFIEYDDDDGDAPGPGYASDGSSDMEAGLDELDDEERRAEQIARREDIEEERLERDLRLAKAERKRKALEWLRAARSR